MGCLFARKMKEDRAVKMLQMNLEWRKENGFEKIPEWHSLNRNLLLADFAYYIPSTRSKNGYGIIYAKFANMIPDDHPNFLEDILKYMIWNNMMGIFLEDMDYHRNGVCFVADFKSVGWKNIDTKLQRTAGSALMDRFPMKISSLLVLHPPIIFKAVVTGVKLFVKKKVMDRVQIIDPEEITKYIDKSQLSSEFGGDIDFTVETMLDWVDQVLANNMAEKTPVKVPYKRKSKDKYPRDLVPHIQLPDNDDHDKIDNKPRPHSARLSKKRTDEEDEGGKGEKDEKEIKRRNRTFSQ